MTPDEQTYFDKQLKSLREKMDARQFELAVVKGPGNDHGTGC